MHPTEHQSTAVASVEMREAGLVQVTLGGAWRLRGRVPRAEVVLDALGPARSGRGTRLVLTTASLDSWDTSLVVFVLTVRELAARRGVACDLAALPEQVRALVDAVPAESGTSAEPAVKPRRKLLTTRLGEQVHRGMDAIHDHVRFFGECVQALARVIVRPLAFRWGDGLEQMRRCGAAALPIVGLISALVGVIMAFVAALQLRQFGADIFVADLVGLAVFREMGPMMAAIVLTGRTGAAFAAELGNMVLGEEVDALETFGVRAVDFLVAPRLLALLLMMPLLALYADFLGVIGGALVAQGVLDIVPAAFFGELQTAVGLKDIGTGLIKSVVFGAIVAYSGCFRGMRAGRSSVAVGEATTGAVVMGILLIIIADAGFTVIFSILDW
ncbi:MAG: ABC transporter permease [Opitutaceae bacterium]|nr:ABC transporter permease [Opitutaceae bacterium]